MKNPPLALLRAIHKAYSARHSSADAPHDSHAHNALFHDGATGNVLPPIIPALNNQGGVGKRRWEDGVVDIVIPRYSFYAVGDNVVLYVDDAYVDDKTVEDADVQLVFAAPVNAFSPSPTNPDYQADVHYHTIDQLGGNVTASRSTLLPVKLTVPGNPPEDRPPGTVVNDSLALPVGVPAELVPVPGIDLPVVIPPYTYMAKGDVITLFWAGAAIPHPPLTADLIGSSITLYVPYTLMAAWPGQAREVRYSIRDRVQNDSLFSRSVFCNVQAQATLPAPVLIGQTGDSFDPDTLAGGAAQITVAGTDLQPNDRVTLHFVGQPLDWPYLHHTEAKPFTGSPLTFNVPNPLIRSLAGSTLNLYYQVQRAATSLRSHGTLVQILGTPLDLPAPYLPDAVGDELVPPEGTAFVDVIVLANTALVPGIDVELRWLGIDGAGDEHSHRFTQAVMNHGAALTLKAPIAWLDEILGGTLEVSYALVAGVVAYGSAVLRYTVAGDGSLLPVPSFTPPLNQADELDLDTFNGSWRVTMALDNPNFAGGTAHLSWAGSGAAQVLTAPVTNVPTSVEVTIDRVRLIEPNLDQNVAVSYQIQRPDGQWARSKTLVLSVINGATRPWPAVQVMDSTHKFVTRFVPQIEVTPGVWEDNTATLWIIDPRLHQGDVIFAVWERPDGTRTNFAPQDSGNGQARINVPTALLAATIGNRPITVKISYFAMVSSVPAPQSEELQLEIAPFRYGAFAAPIFLEAKDAQTLALNDFPGPATVRVAAYPFMALGQTFWLRASGTLDSGRDWSIRLGTSPFTVTAADVAAGSIDRVIERADLLRLRDRSTLTLELKVTLTTSPDESAAIVVPSKNYSLRQLELNLQAPRVQGAVNNTLVIPTTTGTTRITAPYTPEPGQRVQMIWASPAGSPAFVMVPTPPRIMPGSLEFEIPNDKIALSDGLTVPVTYQVTRVEGGETVVSPPVSIYVVVGPASHLEDLSTERPRSIPDGVPEPLRFFTVTFWGGGGEIQQSEIGSSLLRGRVLKAKNRGGCTLSLHRPVSRISFDVDSLPAWDFTVVFVLNDGQRIEHRYWTPIRVAFTPPKSEHRITDVLISAEWLHPIYIDNVLLDYAQRS